MTPLPAATSYVTLGVGKEVFAVEVGIVREILESGPITRLPHAPAFLSGVIDVRGSTVPVIDLRVKLGMDAAPVTQETRILVADLALPDRNLVVGLQVERVFEVAEFESGGLQTPPDIGDGWRSEYIKAIGRLRGDFVIIFDLPQIVQRPGCLQFFCAVMSDSRRGDTRLLEDRDFRRLAEFIHTRSGIRMPPSKRTLLQSRMRRHSRGLGFKSLAEYCRWLFEGGGLAQEESALIDAITTNKTEFFRERHHFDFIATVALPALHLAGSGTLRPLRLWSAGCSNGAEPYSLAMVCEDFARTVSGFRFEILATDISTRILKEAARAIYPYAKIEPVPIELRKRYLLRDDSRSEVRIVPELRRTVKFAYHNLMTEPYPAHRLTDIVLCRNLLIYFDKPTQGDVLSRLCQRVRPGGYLILGHSEGVARLTLPLRPVAPTTFIHESGK